MEAGGSAIINSKRLNSGGWGWSAVHAEHLPSVCEVVGPHTLGRVDEELGHGLVRTWSAIKYNKSVSISLGWWEGRKRRFQ